MTSALRELSVPAPPERRRRRVPAESFVNWYVCCDDPARGWETSSCRSEGRSGRFEG